MTLYFAVMYLILEAINYYYFYYYYSIGHLSHITRNSKKKFLNLKAITMSCQLTTNRNIIDHFHFYILV